MSDLTLLTTVATNSDIEQFDMNYNLIRSLNPDINFKWLITDNTKLDGNNMDVDWSNYSFVEVFDGFSMDFIKKEFSIEKDGYSNYRHGYCLNYLISQVNTKFFVIIDPDFFVFKEDWLSNITGYMKDKDLSFFGAPWFPLYHHKVNRYFPVHYFLLGDLTKVNKSLIDFVPNDYNEFKIKEEGNILSKLSWCFSFDKRKNNVSCNKDTSYGMGSIFKEVKYKTLQPVFKAKKHFNRLVIYVNLFYERFLRDELCYFPKKKGFYRTKGLKDEGKIGAYDDFGFEEYYFNNEIFGVHARSGSFSNKERINNIKKVVDYCK